MMQAFNEIINSQRLMAKKAHFPCSQFFKDLGYCTIAPRQANDSARDIIAAFFQSQNQFDIKAEQTKDLVCVFKYTGDMKLTFACCFFVAEIEKRLIAFINVIRTSSTRRKKGIARTFIQDLRSYMEKEGIDKYQSAHIVVGMSHLLKPHTFFGKCGFKTPLPDFLQCWKIDTCDMAALDLNTMNDQSLPALNQDFAVEASKLNDKS